MKGTQQRQDDPKALPAVPEGTRVYAIGDIHGRADLLARLHRAILRDASGEDAPPRRVVVYLGDYVDRGPDSADVLDMLTESPPADMEPVFLMGNHEALLLDFLGERELGPDSWLLNGGRKTLESYGVDPFAAFFGTSDVAEVAEELRANMPLAHLAFLDRLAVSHREGGYLFVHAGLRPGVPLAEQSDFEMMWIRDGFLESDADFGAVVVHGHTISMKPEIRPNRIGIDTGAFATGHLTCLVLEGTERRFLVTR